MFKIEVITLHQTVKLIFFVTEYVVKADKPFTKKQSLTEMSNFGQI